MYKKTIAFFFALLFMALIIMPTVIIALDDSIDTSMFYSLSEEEETSKVKNVFSPFNIVSTETTAYFNLNESQNFSFKFKSYSKPHLNLIFPPPDYNII